MARPGRLYATIDVNYHDNARVMAAGRHWPLHFGAILASRRLLSDGRLTMGQLRRSCPEGTDFQEALPVCVEVGLLIVENDTVVIPNWAKWNASSQDIENAAISGKKGGHIHHHVNGNRYNPNCEFCRESKADSPPKGTPMGSASSPPVGGGCGRSDQSRPDQSIPEHTTAPMGADGDGDVAPLQGEEELDDQLGRLASRLTAICTAGNKMAVQIESAFLIDWAKKLDPRVVDEVIGQAEKAAKPPLLPRAIASTIQKRAKDAGVPLADFVPPRRRTGGGESS